MATITLTRGLDAMISAFNQQSIEFTIDTGVLPTVTIATLEFSATKTVDNSGGLDTYVFDLTPLLSSLIGIPPEDTTTLSALIYSLSIAISATGATTVTETSLVCFGVDHIGESKIMDVYDYGVKETIYHNGVISFYNKSGGGTYNAVLSGTTVSYTLVNGYNLLTLNASQLKNGTLTFTGTDISIPLIYSPVSGSEITWLNRSGSWSLWNFTLLNSDIKTNKSNEIPIYKQTHAEIKAKSRSISQDKNRIIAFKTIAVDSTHYQQFTEIADSLAIVYDDALWEVESCSTSVADCRQNLAFYLTLKRADYVATY